MIRSIDWASTPLGPVEQWPQSLRTALDILLRSPEIWSIIGPMIDGVMEWGESVWHEDQLIPVDRNGCMEEVFWTFSYSPVLGEDGGVARTLVIVNETT